MLRLNMRIGGSDSIPTIALREKRKSRWLSYGRFSA